MVLAVVKENVIELNWIELNIKLKGVNKEEEEAKIKENENWNKLKGYLSNKIAM